MGDLKYASVSTARPASDAPKRHVLLRPLHFVAHILYLFGLSIWRGGSIVLGSRAGIWLLPGYSLALYGHRFLENTILSIYMRRAIGVAAYAELGIGGSCAPVLHMIRLTAQISAALSVASPSSVLLAASRLRCRGSALTRFC